MRHFQVWAGFLGGCVAIVIAASAQTYASQILITEEEAKLPPPKGAIAVDGRGVTRSPRIEFISGGDTIHSPMRLHLKFESFGGAKIDTDSVKVTYIKSPNVDLTPRLKSFIQPTGIDMPDVELPVGDHMVRVDLKDSDGRAASTSFVLKVAP